MQWSGRRSATPRRWAYFCCNETTLSNYNRSARNPPPACLLRVGQPLQIATKFDLTLERAIKPFPAPKGTLSERCRSKRPEDLNHRREVLTVRTELWPRQPGPFLGLFWVSIVGSSLVDHPTPAIVAMSWALTELPHSFGPNGGLLYVRGGTSRVMAHRPLQGCRRGKVWAIETIEQHARRPRPIVYQRLFDNER